MQLEVSSDVPGVDTLLTMDRTMTLSRACEDRLRKGFRRGEFHGVIWPARGQEAVAAGLGTALRRDDRLVTTYRGIHDLLAKAVPRFERFLAERGVAGAAELARIDRASVTEIDDALRAVRASPLPPAAEVEADVYADMAGVPR